MSLLIFQFENNLQPLFSPGTTFNYPIHSTGHIFPNVQVINEFRHVNGNRHKAVNTSNYPLAYAMSDQFALQKHRDISVVKQSRYKHDRLSIVFQIK